MKCWIYCRVSTEGQKERHTIASQLHLLPKYAAQEGWTIVDTLVDDGISGETIEERPQFRKLLAAMQAGKVDVVLTIDYDRITRSESDEIRGRISDLFRTTNTLWASPVTGTRDFSDPSQRIVMGVEGSMSASEKAKFLSRSKRGKRERARTGNMRWAQPPFGYEWDPATKLYVINSVEAAAVKRAFEIATEHGLTMTAWHLTQEGYKPRKQGRWANTSVGRMLRNRLYLGEYNVFKGDREPIVMKVPSIVGAQQFQRVQDALTRRFPDAKIKHKREYLLAGLAKCGVCDRRIWASPDSKSANHKYSYYRCCTSNQWRQNGLEAPCGNKNHRIDYVDLVVWDKIQEVLQDPKLLADACAIADKPAKGQDWEKQAKTAEKRLQKLTRHEQDMLARSRNGQISQQALDNELREIARERDLHQLNLKRAQQALGSRQAKQKLAKDLTARAQQLAKRLGSASFETKRQLVRLIVAKEYGGKIVIHWDGSIDIYGTIPVGGELVQMHTTAKYVRVLGWN